MEELQCKRLAEVKSRRSADAVAESLAAVKDAAATPDVNLMPVIHGAVLTDATVGEIMNALAEVFGRWREVPRI